MDNVLHSSHSIITTTLAMLKCASLSVSVSAGGAWKETGSGGVRPEFQRGVSSVQRWLLAHSHGQARGQLLSRLAADRYVCVCVCA